MRYFDIFIFLYSYPKKSDSILQRSLEALPGNAGAGDGWQVAGGRAQWRGADVGVSAGESAVPWVGWGEKTRGFLRF